MNRFLLCLVLCIIFMPLGAFAEEVQVKTDSLVETTLQNVDIKKPYIHKEYDYEPLEKIPLKISLQNPIKSEKNLYEGEIVYFIVQKSIYENNRIKIRRGDRIKARVSTIISSGMNGIPASVIFDDFEFIDCPKKIKYGQVTDTLEIFGQDRTYFVFPLKWALTILPPTGSLTNFIKGGHVRVNTKKIFTLYYHPKWL